MTKKVLFVFVFAGLLPIPLVKIINLRIFSYRFFSPLNCENIFFLNSKLWSIIFFLQNSWGKLKRPSGQILLFGQILIFLEFFRKMPSRSMTSLPCCCCNAGPISGIDLCRPAQLVVRGPLMVRRSPKPGIFIATWVTRLYFKLFVGSPTTKGW